MKTTSSETGKTGQSGRWKLWLLLLLIVAATVTMVAIPVFVIVPSKAQTAAGLEWSYRLRRWGPAATVIATVIFLALCVRLWPGARWRGRLAIPAPLSPLLALPLFARPNPFRWVVNPPPTPPPPPV